MKKLRVLAGLLLLAVLLLTGCEAPATLTVVPSPVVEEAAAPEATSEPEAAPEEEAPEAESMLGAAAKAVDLLGAWADAGAPETDAFEYTGVDGNTYEGSYDVDIQPLFTENNLWFDGAQACTGCHFANSENSYHEMDLTSYEGIMSGGDVLSEPPGVPYVRPI
ncbi:MAG: hypothetical protein HN736_11225 [Anaerolineae bacterium]|jgi:hypothetical protein|nr:hypothetical protein [Anaerolineae bacterium]MBT3714004.1 hypothetical protein [Anaerolineae bacterium]MBT4311046.1 hypothetical protein [Anaerolineae bacterium]MBT4459898.1 hypothetical protein [Anaerolineae bacterium]MBT4841781.1 hypothetical protein [Anaerolineae bacterium]